MGNRPLKKWRSGAIEGCIWLNKKETEEGEIEFQTISLSRSWKKKGEDIWRSDVMNIRKNDIPRLLVILNNIQQDILLSDKSKEGG